ncbi:MAG: hypothetical protein J2P46_19185, partial [Zavarzinella sp.]|nr:hypothetical protein [Zavarzinella sp.]
AGRLGYLTVRSDVRAASVDVQEGDLGSVTIGGSLFGGDTANAGEISATGSVGPVIIKGDVIGSTGVWSGSISSGGALAGLTIGGSLRGGAGAASGRILGQGSVGPVRVGHDVAGAAGQDSGSIQAKGLLAGVTVGGSVTGGSGEDAGTIASGGAAGFVTIRGDLAGAGGEESGNVFSAGNLSRITVGGSVTGGTSRFSGRIEAMGDVGTVAIGRDLVGGRASGAASLYETGIIRARRIARLTLGGSLVAGTDNSTGDYFANGGIQVVNDIGTLAIRGSILGDPDHPAFILARGSAAPTATADIAIGRLTVRGRVEFAQIVAGVDPFGLGPDADAQIGAVSVGGDWIASSLAAGAVAGRDGFFGDADDAKATGSQAKDDPRLVSAIVRVTIGGQIVGTPNGGDHFGIVAEAVRAVSVAGDRLPLIPGPHNDDFPTGNTRDFTVRELPGP